MITTIIVSLLIFWGIVSLQAKESCENTVRVIKTERSPGIWIDTNMPLLSRDANYKPPIEEAILKTGKMQDLLQAKFLEEQGNWQVDGCWIVLVEPSKNYLQIIVRLVKQKTYLKKHGAAEEVRVKPNSLDIDDQFFEDNAPAIVHEVLKKIGKPIPNK